MNETQLNRSWKIGLAAMGLIPVIQLCYLAHLGQWCRRNGIDFMPVLANPPLSLFVSFPAAAFVAAAGLATNLSFIRSQREQRLQDNTPAGNPKPANGLTAPPR